MADEQTTQAPPPPVAQTQAPAAAPVDNTYYDTNVLDELTDQLIDLPYDQATSELVQAYSTHKWADKEKAAQVVAAKAHILNQQHGKSPDAKLTTDAAALGQIISDPAASQEDKLAAVEEWRKKGKEDIYNPAEPDNLLHAYDSEQLLDHYATELRRNIVNKNEGWIKDKMVRGSIAALSPIAGVTDMITGSDYKRKAADWELMHTNPDRDGTIASSLASGVGSLAGITAAGVVPGGAEAYLGAMAVDQLKDIHDRAAAEAGPEAGIQAAAGSAPGVLLQTFALGEMGDTLSGMMKGAGSVGEVLSHTALGAAGMGGQTYLTGKATAEATLNPDMEPSAAEVGKQALVGGILGAGASGLHAILGAAVPPEEAAIKNANKKFNAAMGRGSEGKPIPGSEEHAVDSYYEGLTTKEGETPPTVTLDSVLAPEQIPSAKPIGEVPGEPTAEESKLAEKEGGVEAEKPIVEEPAAVAENLVRQPPTPESVEPPSSPEEAVMANVAGAAPAEAVGPRGPLPESMQSNLQKIYPVTDTGFTPNHVSLWLASQLTKAIRLKSRILQKNPSYFGYFNPKTKEMGLSPRIFKTPKEAGDTIAHELGHAFEDASRDKVFNEAISRPSLPDDPPEVKAGRLWLLTEKINADRETFQEGRDLSNEWRPGWEKIEDIPSKWKMHPPKKGDPDYAKYLYQKYRNNPSEIQADAFSAILQRPRYVEQNYPRIWKTFQEGLDSEPELKSFWDKVQSMNENPNVLTQSIREERTRSAKLFFNKRKEAEAARAAKMAEPMKFDKPALKKWWAESVQQMVSFNAPFREFIKQARGGKLADVSEYLNNLAYKLRSNPSRTRVLDHKLYNILDELRGVELSAAKDAETGAVKLDANGNPVLMNPAEVASGIMKNRAITDSRTLTMENALADERGYKDGFKVVQDEAAKLYAKDKGKSPVANINAEDATGINFVDQMAKSHTYLPEKTREALSSHIMYERGKNLSPADIKAMELLDNKAFDSRRYMGNPEGLTYVDAERDLKITENQIGTPNFQKINGLLDQMHDALFSHMYPSLKDSKILPPDALKKMEINKRSYATFNALRYFLDDPEITASLIKASGSLGPTVESIAATITKIKKVAARADRQIVNNAMVDAASLKGDAVEEVPLGYSKNIYDEQRELQRSDKDSSYIIGTDSGKATLYKINDPRWAHVLDKAGLDKIPVIGKGINAIEAFTKMTLAREFFVRFNPTFFIRTKIYHRQQEALIGRDFDPTGMFHLSIMSDAKAVWADVRAGKFNQTWKTMVDNEASIDSIPGFAGGYDRPGVWSPEDLVAHQFGFTMPGEEELGVPIKINRWLNEKLEKTWFGKISKGLDNEVAVSKIATFLIGKEVRGMSDARAARLAREGGSIPDPLGGGIQATALNKLFVFYRAHVNGLRFLADEFGEDKKAFALQFAYRKLMPRLLVSTAMAPFLGALFGDETKKVYQKWLDKLPSFHLATAMVVPLGFTDEQGHFRLIGSVDSSEITPGWKATYFTFPYSRTVISADTLLQPAYDTINHLVETGGFSFKNLGASIKEAFSRGVMAEGAPGIFSAIHMGQFATGGNPYDFYRNRGVFTKDEQDAGSTLEKAYDYMLWSANQEAPGIFSYNSDRSLSTEPLSPFDYLAKSPVAGPALRSFIRNSNYGEYEKNAELANNKLEVDASVRRSMGSSTQMLKQEYGRLYAQRRSLGKDVWNETASDDNKRMFWTLQNWHTRAYKFGFNGIRSAMENGDAVETKDEADKLEENSKYYMEMLKR